jgi:hypothetical protein
MTGGIGRERLSSFYRHHFVFNNPEDTVLELVSRTVGIDRVIDEFILVFTHTKQIDWLYVNMPPANIFAPDPTIAYPEYRLLVNMFVCRSLPLSMSEVIGSTMSTLVGIKHRFSFNSD